MVCMPGGNMGLIITVMFLDVAFKKDVGLHHTPSLETIGKLIGLETIYVHTNYWDGRQESTA